MRGKSFFVGVAVLAAGLIFVTGGGAATTHTVTLTVNSTADSTTPCTIASNKSTGTCTLRGAILAANALQQDNTMFLIKLAAGKYALNQGSLMIQANTANTGNIVEILGKSKTTGKGKHKKTMPASIIDGSANAKPASVFEVYSPAQMLNVVITGGSGSNGGGVYMESALDLENAVIQGNTSCASWTGDSCTSYDDGGGIYLGGNNSVTPHLTMSNVTVTKNVGWYGGGIANENSHHTSIVAFNSHFDKNVACNTFTNGVCTGGGDGGGIYDYGESLLLENSTVNGNVAGSPTYDTNSWNTESGGGGVYTHDTAQFIHTVISGNVAGQFGGGVFAYDHADFVNSKVSNNTVDYEGGGVYVEYLMTSKSSTFSGNVAGGTFECTTNGSSTTCKHATKTTNGTCTSLYPSASACISYDGYGGGIYTDAEYPQFVASTISKNIAASLAGDATGCGGGQGGGLYSWWTATFTDGSKVTGNSADCGGGIYNYGSSTESYTLDLAHTSLTKNSALEDGGAIWTMGAGSTTLYWTKISGNTAGHQTGGVWDDQLGAVILGSGNTIAKNASPGACKNITQPCK